MNNIERGRNAAEHLRKFQGQCDAEGVVVEVSREALDYVLDGYRECESKIKQLEARIATKDDALLLADHALKESKWRSDQPVRKTVIAAMSCDGSNSQELQAALDDLLHEAKKVWNSGLVLHYQEFAKAISAIEKLRGK